MWDKSIMGYKTPCKRYYETLHDQVTKITVIRPLLQSVTVQLTDPSHGWAYVAEGLLLLGSDWLVIDPEPCSFLHCHVLYWYIVSVVSLSPDFGEQCYHCYLAVECFIVPLTWCLVSHDGLISYMDLSPCLLMFQGVLYHSITTSYCTRIAVLTWLFDYYDS